MLCPPYHTEGTLSKAFGRKENVYAEKSIPGQSEGFAAFIAKTSSNAEVGKQRDTTLLGESSNGRQQLPILHIKNETRSNQKPTDPPSAQINKIGHAIRTIYSSTNDTHSYSNFSFETLYHVTDDIVNVAKQGQDLYERVQMEMERAVGQIANNLRSSTSKDDQDDPIVQYSWLTKLSAFWKDWCEHTTLVCNVLILLDQGYILRQSQVPSLWNLSLELFKHSVCQGEGLQERIYKSIANVCDNVRMGQVDDYRQLHLLLLPIFTSLDMYDSLEQELLDSMKTFYANESAKAITNLDVKDYLIHADQVVQREREYSLWLYLGKTGSLKSQEIVHEQVISNHSDRLIEGLPQLLSNVDDSILAITLLYDFLRRVKKLPILRTTFGKYICEEGEKIVLDREKDAMMIDRLLEYKASIDKIVCKAFKDDQEFRQTQKDNFETFVNKRENKPAELIAKYLDARLRSGNKTMSDQEMEHILNEALILFRYTHAKDMFEEFYKRLFAKRLLLNRSASSDAEQSMLLKLKEECGPAFTQKLETMLTDIALSEEMMGAYNTSREKISEQGATEPFELSVSVLTQAHWPTYPQVELIIPSEMSTATERFAKFYETRNQGRTLHWTHSLGTNSIIANFAKAGEKELLVSTFQAVILLLFNELPAGQKLSYDQIKQQTGLEEKELKRTLLSLASGQIPTRVLRKDPQGKDVNEGDQFSVNEQLKNERKRIRINMIQLNETQEEQKSTVDRVMFDRELVLQATAVRILKAKKTIKHAELLQEIVQSIASRFTVDVGEIKKTFEILIEKEYMERVEGQRGVYRYLA